MLRATSDFQSSTLGYVSKGDLIEHNQHGRELLEVGLAERVPETKTVESTPTAPKDKPPTDPKRYGTKVVENKGRKTKTKGTSRGRKRNRSDSASS